MVVAFLTKYKELFLRGPPHVLQKVNVGRKGVVQCSLGAATLLQVLLIVRLEQSVPQIAQTEFGLFKDFLKTKTRRKVCEFMYVFLKRKLYQK